MASCFIAAFYIFEVNEFLATILAALTAMAQQAPVNSPLLDHLAGKWLLQGTVGKQPVTHDFDAEWVLQNHYLRFREVSREKNDKGEPEYEATVFVGWNEKTRQYACVWMDVYGGATSESIGLATPQENELAFVFTDEHGTKRQGRGKSKSPFNPCRISSAFLK
jgi:hypothetical protein